MFPFGGIIMKSCVVKTISAGAWRATEELLHKRLQECARWGQCQVLINIFSCKPCRKLINSLNLQHTECPQLPPKSRINRNCICWGDTSLWLLICAPWKCRKHCRTAAVGKPSEGQGVPVATEASSQIHIQPWTEHTWNYKNPSSATLKSKIVTQLFSATVFTLKITFPHWNNAVNSNAREKKHFWMRQGGNY